MYLRVFLKVCEGCGVLAGALVLLAEETAIFERSPHNRLPGTPERGATERRTPHTPSEKLAGTSVILQSSAGREFRCFPRVRGVGGAKARTVAHMRVTSAFRY